MITIKNLKDLLAHFPDYYGVSAFEDDEDNYLGVFHPGGEPAGIIITTFIGMVTIYNEDGTDTDPLDEDEEAAVDNKEGTEV